MPIVEATDVSSKSFNFVIIGGGTAGLTLAARLSEIPSVTVLVLEAGQKNFGDPEILTPGRVNKYLGDPKYDWSFMTTKQEHANDRQISFNRGKGLGGSSAVNFYVWMKPPAADVDAFEALGNPGWNWAAFDKYLKKAESFHVPTKEQTDVYSYTYDLDARGTSGPIQTTIPPHFYAVDKLVMESLVNKGLKANKNPHGGDNTGTWIASSNVDPKTWTRSYATTAYLQPNLARPNLTVVTDALVSRILFTDVVGQDLTAYGVEFIHNDHVYTVKANKEVILCAG
ncbi:FAD/NAD(P)-binding domain-containing protein [Phlegmacium glaucopus]|nr:FAD/NAD(P)-binding domain-containing protein [Phlegmacium glaucopus]